MSLPPSLELCVVPGTHLVEGMTPPASYKYIFFKKRNPGFPIFRVIPPPPPSRGLWETQGELENLPSTFVAENLFWQKVQVPCLTEGRGCQGWVEREAQKRCWSHEVSTIFPKAAGSLSILLLGGVLSLPGVQSRKEQTSLGQSLSL